MTGKDLVEHVHPSRPDYAEEEAIAWWSRRPRYERRLNATLLLSQADDQKLKRMRPMCDRCGTPVRSFEYVYTGLTCTITVRCHGESETMDVGLDDILDLISSGTSGGRAFVGPKALK